MIAPADARLAAEDPSLPGLGLVLDPEAWAQELAAALPRAGVRGARATYVRYKPGTSCLVAFRVRVGDGEQDVYARALRPSAHDKLAAARRRQEDRSNLGPGGLVLERWAVAVHVFPHDRRLPALARLGDAGHHHVLLERILATAPALAHGELQRLRYNPERRWVGRLTAADGERALVKMAAPARARRALRAASALAEAVPAPAVLGSSARHGITVTRWLDGTPLDALLSATPSAAGAAGRALAGLHGADGAGLRARSAHKAAGSLRAAAEAVGVIAAAPARRAGRLARDLAAQPGSGAVHAVHGDFSADQVLMCDGEAVLLDLDRARRDNPACDLATFVAELELRVVRGTLSRRAAGQAEEALLEAYCDAGGPAVTHGPTLARDVAAALLLRAVEPFRLRERCWPEQVEMLVGAAERAASGGDRARGRLLATG